MSGKRLQLCPYDPAWVGAFDTQRRRITGALGPALLQIEHVGSTSVSGLTAKPVIDIALAVGSVADADRCIQPLEALGYEYRGMHGEDVDRRYYVLEQAGVRAAQIHLWILPAAGWDRMLRFRDVLRADSSVREAYVREKLRVADLVGWDKLAYSLAKAPFIESVLEKSGRRDCEAPGHDGVV